MWNVAAGLFIELDFAIYVGVIASLSVFVYETAYPEVTVTAPVDTPQMGRKFVDITMHGESECPQLIVIHITGSLYFGSVNNVDRAIKKIRDARPGQKNIVLYLKSVRSVSLTSFVNVIRFETVCCQQATTPIILATPLGDSGAWFACSFC